MLGGESRWKRWWAPCATAGRSPSSREIGGVQSSRPRPAAGVRVRADRRTRGRNHARARRGESRSEARRSEHGGVHTRRFSAVAMRRRKSAVEQPSLSPTRKPDRRRAGAPRRARRIGQDSDPDQGRQRSGRAQWQRQTRALESNAAAKVAPRLRPTPSLDAGRPIATRCPAAIKRRSERSLGGRVILSAPVQLLPKTGLSRGAPGPSSPTPGGRTPAAADPSRTLGVDAEAGIGGRGRRLGIAAASLTRDRRRRRCTGAPKPRSLLTAPRSTFAATPASVCWSRKGLRGSLRGGCPFNAFATSKSAARRHAGAMQHDLQNAPTSAVAALSHHAMPTIVAEHPPGAKGEHARRFVGCGSMARKMSRPRKSATAKRVAAPRQRAAISKRWSGHVTRHSNALDLEEGVFTWKDPARIAASLKRSAEASTRRKADPYRSALSMLIFYVNRAGKNLPQAQKGVLKRAKVELRKAFGRYER